MRSKALAYRRSNGHHARTNAPASPSTFASASAQAHATSREKSSDEDIRRLLQACETGRGNADLLRETLVYTKPEDLKAGDLIQEFCTRCRESQQYIVKEIPWVSSDAELSRLATWTDAETKEEKLLAELLAANESLTEALKMYDDLERVADEAEERERFQNEQRVKALTAVADFVPTKEENELLDRLFTIGDVQDSGMTISTKSAVKILVGSGLPPATLSDIWDIANVEDHPGLHRQSLGVALRLIGHTQKGAPVDVSLVLEPGPLATIDGLLDSAQDPAPVFEDAVPGLLPMTEQEKAKYMKIFLANGPTNGMVTAEQARALFLKSRLPVEKLSQIWNIADAHDRGLLDAEDFAVAMHLINGSMSGKLASIPSSLPRSFYEQSDLQPPRPAVPQLDTNVAGPSHSRSVSGMSSPVSRLASSPTSSQKWIISPTLKASSDAAFDAIDTPRTGYVSGDVFHTFMLDSGLSMDVLARICALADTSQRGRLTKNEFAVASFLVEMAKEGKELPNVLPPELLASVLSMDARPRLPTLAIGTSSPRDESSPVINPLDGLVFNSSRNLSTRTFTPVNSVGLSPIPVSPSTPSSISVGHPYTPERLSPASSRTPVTPPGPSENIASPLSSAFSSPPLSLPPTPRRTASQTTIQTVDISLADKRRADKFFDMLDPWRKGKIEGDVAVSFFGKSKLSKEVLAHIWDLADSEGVGYLTRDEFALAMHLIWRKAAGKDIPRSRPFAVNMPSISQPVHARSESTGSVPGFEGAERSATPPPPYDSIAVGT